MHVSSDMISRVKAIQDYTEYVVLVLDSLIKFGYEIVENYGVAFTMH